MRLPDVLLNYVLEVLVDLSAAKEVIQGQKQFSENIEWTVMFIEKAVFINFESVKFPTKR